MKVLVTGANGFVGHYLCSTLVESGYDVLGATKSDVKMPTTAKIKLHACGDIGAEIDWRPVLRDVDCVVHLAARVHVMRDKESDPLAAFRRTNVSGTERLLRSVGKSRVKRLIFLSTVKIHGDMSSDKPFSATDAPEPPDPYAQSKLEAENVVEELGAELGLETVIVRPPLVYGPGVGGNFLRLLRLIENGVPLPFASIENRRSLVGVSNLCDLIRECLVNPSAAGQTFLVSDNNDLSTPGLIRHLAAAMDRRPRLIPFPPTWLRLAASLFGRSEEVSRLIDSLQVDVHRTMDLLGWSPPVSVSDEIGSTVRWYMEQARHAGN